MLNKNEIITNKIEEKGIEEKTYQYTMHNYSIEGIFSIMTYELGIIVFSIKLCKPIILKPKVLNIGFYQVGGENFIKLYDKDEQEIYDAEGRLLEKANGFLEVIYGGKSPMIKINKKGSKRFEYIPVT